MSDNLGPYSHWRRIQSRSVSIIMSRGDRVTVTGIISTSMRDNYGEYGVAEAGIYPDLSSCADLLTPSTCPSITGKWDPHTVTHITPVSDYVSLPGYTSGCILAWPIELRNSQRRFIDGGRMNLPQSYLKVPVMFFCSTWPVVHSLIKILYCSTDIISGRYDPPLY